MDNRQFVEDYKEAFGEKATLPIAFGTAIRLWLFLSQ